MCILVGKDWDLSISLSWSLTSSLVSGVLSLIISFSLPVPLLVSVFVSVCLSDWSVSSSTETSRPYDHPTVWGRHPFVVISDIVTQQEVSRRCVCPFVCGGDCHSRCVWIWIRSVTGYRVFPVLYPLWQTQLEVMTLIPKTTCGVTDSETRLDLGSHVLLRVWDVSVLELLVTWFVDSDEWIVW